MGRKGDNFVVHCAVLVNEDQSLVILPRAFLNDPACQSKIAIKPSVPQTASIWFHLDLQEAIPRLSPRDRFDAQAAAVSVRANDVERVLFGILAEEGWG